VIAVVVAGHLDVAVEAELDTCAGVARPHEALVPVCGAARHAIDGQVRQAVAVEVGRRRRGQPRTLYHGQVADDALRLTRDRGGDAVVGEPRPGGRPPHVQLGHAI